MEKIFDNKKLFEKYDIYADDYTDYPHKSQWGENYKDKDFREALTDTFSNNNKIPTLFYAHTPFCEKLCYCCICHKEITKDYNKIKNHFDVFLSKEIKILANFFDENSLKPNFKEVYLGGGSPTLLKENEFDKLVDLMSRFLNPKKLERFCVETDPRTISPEKIRYYITKGVNNLSIGVQDFEPKVQKAVNRVQPAELVQKLLAEDIREKIKSINFDFLVGLPFQTEKTMVKSMKKAVELGPDRISLCFFHYTTKFHPHMKLLEKHLPNFYQRKRIFQAGVNTLIDSGYIRTGFEHFAKKGDVVEISLGKRKATYTSLGVIGKATNVVATGRSGHSILGDSYLFQNYYEQELYGGALDKNNFPIYRGMKLSEDDVLRRNIIRKLRTYFEVEIDNKYFQKEIFMLKEFEKDALVELGNKIKITERGKMFTDLIISVFNNYLTELKWKNLNRSCA